MSVPIKALSPIEFDEYIQLLNKVMDWLEQSVQPGQQGWIPIDERLPEVDEDGCSKYILISCSNFSLPTIGRYQQEKDGSGAFYDGDDETTMASYGLIVNAWMPLPENYSEGEEE